MSDTEMYSSLPGMIAYLKGKIDPYCNNCKYCEQADFSSDEYERWLCKSPRIKTSMVTGKPVKRFCSDLRNKELKDICGHDGKWFYPK